MLTTEAIITAIDYSSNKCSVRVPLFENPNKNNSVIMEGRICIQPGSFNNYSIDDLVWVTFVDNKVNLPLIIGKIYSSPNEENTVIGGVSNIDTININSKASLPENTSFKNIGTITNLINRIKELEIEISKLNVEINNLKNK